MPQFCEDPILISFVDTQCENMSILQTIISTSQDPNQTLAFNMASQAMNNSFFLDQLVSNELFQPNYLLSNFITRDHHQNMTHYQTMNI